jgi:hypothetical protein
VACCFYWLFCHLDHPARRAPPTILPQKNLDARLAIN